MTDQFKEILNELSKDQLIYLIEKFYDSQFIISEICVAESKLHITPKTAIKKIRYNLCDLPNTYDAEYFKAYLDYDMDKITVDEYRKILGLD